MRDAARTFTVALAFAVSFFAVPALLLGGVSDVVSVAAGAFAGVSGALVAARIVYDHSGASLAARAARDYAGVFVTLVSAGVVAAVAPSTAIVVVGGMAATCALLGLGTLGVIGRRVIDHVTGGERR